MGQNALDDRAFAGAFGRRSGVHHRVARAAVQEAVVAARCPGVDVAPFKQQTIHAPQGQVAGQTRAACARADNDHLIGLRHTCPRQKKPKHFRGIFPVLSRRRDGMRRGVEFSRRIQADLSETAYENARRFP